MIYVPKWTRCCSDSEMKDLIKMCVYMCVYLCVCVFLSWGIYFFKHFKCQWLSIIYLLIHLINRVCWRESTGHNEKIWLCLGTSPIRLYIYDISSPIYPHILSNIQQHILQTLLNLFAKTCENDARILSVLRVNKFIMWGKHNSILKESIHSHEKEFKWIY